MALQAGEEALLERDDELAALADALAPARDGRGTLSVVEGAAGIGKSRLLEATRAEAEAHGMQVLRAHGSEAESEFPFGVALQLFERLVQEADAELHEALLSGSAALAQPLVSGEQDGGGALGTLFPLLHGLFWLTVNLAERGPVAIIVDDAHWADEASLRFLAYLAQRVDDIAVAIVLALRSGDPAARRDEVTALAAHRSARLMRPAGLSREAIAAMVRLCGFEDADEAFVDSCADVSRGNPYLLQELLRTLRAEGVPPTAEQARTLREMAPESVARSVLLRMSRVSAEALTLARATAILGEDARLDRAAEIAELSTDAAAAAAAELVAIGVLAREAELEFAHPMTLAAVAGDMPASERAFQHGRVAALLDRSAASAERVTAHLLRAPAIGEPWAYTALRKAAAASLARGAPRAASAALARALEEPLPEGDEEAVLSELARAQLAAGEPGVIDALERALEVSSDPVTGARLADQLGEALFAQGRLAEATIAYRDGLARVRDADTELARDLAARLVALGSVEPSAREDAERYRPELLTGAAERTYAERRVLANLAAAGVFVFQPAEEVRRLALRALGDGDLIAAEGANGISWHLANAALAWADSLEPALDACAQALDAARREGTVIGFATASFCRATPSYWSGRLAGAAADAEQALRGRADGWAAYVGPAAGVLALALIERDELSAAEAAIGEAGDLDTMLPHMTAYVLHARGVLRLERRDSAGALADQLLAGERVASQNPGIMPWRSQAALAALRLGDRDQAVELAQAELELAERFGAERPIGTALTALGLATGGDEGLALLARAVEVLDESPSELARGRALAAYGGALRRAGQRSEARDVLLRALELAGSHGAVRAQIGIREELATLGMRPRRTAQAGAAALTPSERRVAELAASGLTNRLIAETLFVTPKTVEWHMRSVFQKLNLKSRRELADALEG